MLSPKQSDIVESGRGDHERQKSFSKQTQTFPAIQPRPEFRRPHRPQSPSMPPRSRPHHAKKLGGGQNNRAARRILLTNDAQMVEPSSLPEPDSQENPNERQWRLVYQGCEKGLRGFLRGRLGQEVDVEDCLQAVCVKMILQSRKSPDDVLPAARRAWLFRVAANEAAALWRRRASTERMIQRQGAADAVPEDFTQQLIHNETAAQIRRAIEALPEPVRQVVRLRIQENLTFQQIAEQLNIPLGTALSRMRRAIATLKQEIFQDDQP
jgi:RNA polymerase sigma-70 factor (ECF subfamily)